MLTYKVKTAGQILLIPTEDIFPAKINTRTIKNSENFSMLVNSVKTSGILNPLIVKSINNGQYEIICGNRRLEAAKTAGFTYVPCVLISSNDVNSLILSITDNFHRSELHFLEVASNLEKLRNFMSIEMISEYLSIPEGLILSRTRLLTLPENIKWKIITANLSESTAFNLCKITDKKRQNEIVDLMISSNLEFNEAFEITKSTNKKSVFIAHYKDYTVFLNTIEHAVDTMTASGINAKCTKNENNTSIVYTVTINKSI